MNYLDLFSGVGGFHEGLKQSGFNFEWVGFSEIEKDSIKIYKKHYPKAVNLGDVQAITTNDLPKIDIITFGFPCQDLSIAGKQRGIEGSRSGLFFEAVRLVRELKPDIFIFENVKGLLTGNQGRDFETVLRTIANLGCYDCEWQLLNSSWFIPQNRERIFFIGHLRGKSRPKVFPFRETDKFCIESRKNKEKIFNIASCLMARQYANWAGNFIKIGTWRTHEDGKGFRENKEGISPTIPARKREDGSGQPVIMNNNEIRRLTPIECERLQGFTDNWTEGVSDASRYKALGNAVTVSIVKEIGKRLLKKD